MRIGTFIRGLEKIRDKEKDAVIITNNEGDVCIGSLLSFNGMSFEERCKMLELGFDFDYIKESWFIKE